MPSLCAALVSSGLPSHITTNWVTPINRSSLSHCSRGWISEIKMSELYPSNGCREEPFLASSWLLVVVGNPWHSLALWTHRSIICLYLHVAFFPLCESVSLYPDLPLLSLMKTPVIALRAHPTPVGAHLNLITSTKALFPNKVTFTALRSGLEHIFWETRFNLPHLPKASTIGLHMWWEAV